MPSHSPKHVPTSGTGRSPAQNIVAIVGASVLAVTGGFFALRGPEQPGSKPATHPAEGQPAYQDFLARLERITDPKDVRDQSMLSRIIDDLALLTIPAERQAEWAGSEAVKRREEYLTDARALDQAVYEVQHLYRKLSEDGNEVLAHKEAANLPQRARTVLDRAKELPDKASFVGRSHRIRYAAIYEFAIVRDAAAEWELVRKTIEPLASGERPAR